MIARAFVALAVLLELAGCDRCRKDTTKPPVPQPAGPRERAAIDHLLNGPSDLPPDLAAFKTYESLLGELEKNPQAALLAVRERSAPANSREALFLKVLEHRFSNVSSHRRRLATLDHAREPGGQIGASYPLEVAGLTGRDSEFLWTELLLLEGGMGQLAAIRHLDRIGTPLALEALTYLVSTPEIDFSAEEAARALGRRGEAERLITALGAWETVTTTPEGAAPLAGLAYLRPDAHASANSVLIAGLEASDASPRRRTMLLHGIAITGDKDTITRLAALRQTSWGEAQKGEIDAAIERIATRAPPDKTQPPIDWNEDLITGEKRRQGQLLRKLGGP